MILAFYILIGLYALLIISFVLGFIKTRVFSGDLSTATTAFSIVIPFRNEAENLPTLISSLEALNYPSNLFEVILVDDESSDHSAELSLHLLNATHLDFSILKNERQSHSPKKDAINTALDHSKYPWIITTDADCKVPPNWLQLFHSFIQKHDISMVVAPVSYTNNSSWFHQFQTLDILSLQGATLGAFGIKRPFMCNGANLCYKKRFFQALNGFEDNNNIASGDDIFLLEKALKHSKKQVAYLKHPEAIVLTNPEKTLGKLFHQRIRWAAKSSAYKNTFSKIVGLLVLSTNALIVSLFLLSFLDLLSWIYFFSILIIKASIDYWHLYVSAKFFKQTKALNIYIFSCLFYPLFTVFVAVYAMLFNYKWKGREFKK